MGRAAGPRQQAEQGGRNLATATAAIAGMKASKSARASSMKCATLVVPRAVPAQPGIQHRTPHPAQPARQRLAYQVTGPGCCAVAAAGWEQGIQRTLCTRGLVAKPGEHATRQLATSRRSAKYSTCPPSRSRAPTFQVLHTACCRACSQCERSGEERNTASFGPASARHSTQHWGLSASAGSDPCARGAAVGSCHCHSAKSVTLRATEERVRCTRSSLPAAAASAARAPPPPAQAIHSAALAQGREPRSPPYPPPGHTRLLLLLNCSQRRHRTIDSPPARRLLLNHILQQRPGNNTRRGARPPAPARWAGRWQPAAPAAAGVPPPPAPAGCGARTWPRRRP